MYPNLRAEKARTNVADKDLAAAIGMSASTYSAKVNGKTEFTLAECKAIKAELGTELTLEELFMTEGE